MAGLNQMTAQRLNCVYRYYDKAGRLIYVGVTVRGIKRQQEHNESSEWFQFVADQQVEQCVDRNESLRVERELIRVYRPPFNKVHNEGWEVLRAAYMKIVAAEEAFAAIQAGGKPAIEACGHCSGCYLIREGVTEDYAVCRRLSGETEDVQEGPCDMCGSPDCIYVDGQQDKDGSGYREGYDNGSESTEYWLSRKLHPMVLPGRMLSGISQGFWNWGNGANLPIYRDSETDARDACLRDLSDALAAGTFAALVEDAGKVPF